jgi:hypothetical protein
MEKQKRQFVEQLRSEVEKVAKYFEDQLLEDRRKHLKDKGALTDSLLQAHILLEEVKVSETSAHVTVQYYQVL